VSKKTNETTLLILSLLITTGLVGGGIWFLTKNGLNLGILVNSQLKPTEQSSSNFTQVKNVPNGLFSYGGSTTWAPIRQVAEPAIQSSLPNFHLRYVQPTNKPPGSKVGIEMLINDQLTFSQSSSSIDKYLYQQAQARGFTLKEIPVAIDGIAVAVNPSLNISGLTVAQLKDIYTGQVTNWSQVGGPNLPITIYSRRGENSGTVKFFIENVLQGQQFSPNTQYIPTTTEAARAVSTNLGGVYFASAPEVVGQCKIKTLPIGLKSDKLVPPYQEPFVPLAQCPHPRNQVNAVAFRSGEYPLTRQLFVIVKQDGQITQQAGEAYANLLLTDQGQELIQQTGFVRIR